MAPSGQYLAETVFFLRSLSAISISIRDLHSGGVSNMTCLSYNKTISTNIVYQGLETELNHMMKHVDHG